MNSSEIKPSEQIMKMAEEQAELILSEMKKENAETKRKHKKSLIKLTIMLILLAIIIAFSTIAWFTMSREVGSSGMGMKAEGQNFELRNLSGSKDGIFKEYHDAVHEEEALYWGMTATNNLQNYNEPEYDENNELTDPGDLGIHPGTEGVISFNVISKTNSVDLNFDFEILGYQASYNDVNNTPDDHDDDELVMTLLSDLAGGDGTTAQNLLNGHILLFEHRSGTAGNYVYSMPICSNADMHRIMNRTVTNENPSTQIDIYWVWPNTLSNLIDASDSGVTTVPFCIDNDSYGYNSYSAITRNIESYPQYYLKGTSSGDTITSSGIGAHYTSYGDMYDQGDNEIGMRVHYILIKLSVTEGTTVGGGS